MNPQVCVHCQNKKPVNFTDNRLVTESCGHVKCMDCLLREKSGCIACLKDKPREYLEGVTVEREVVENNLPVVYETNKQIQTDAYDDSTKKKKPETSHIRIETDTNGKYYVCTVCKKKFHARSQVAYHAYCNGQRKPYQCPECNKSFATHSHFKYHMRVHRNERTYACDVCGDGFFQMSKLQRHKLKHTKEKKYVCSQCNKAFNNVTSLRKHGLTHTEERPYACPTCGRRFRDTSNYRKHVAKHNDKKCACGGTCARGACRREGKAAGDESSGRAYQCPRCPHAFHSNKDMRRHLSVHTDSKPFRCKVCNRRFRRKDNLERHIRNTHPDYLPSSAVECDENALKEITSVNKQIDTPEIIENKEISEQVYENNEKTKLEILNPLPPLPQEVIQKHMQMEVNENVSQNEQQPLVRDRSVDKSYILEANNARQSVIFGPVKRDSTTERKSCSPHPEFEYVHKIRKANHMASQKDVPLPPIDEKKIIELEQKTSLNLDLGAPPKNVELYKKILYERPAGDKDATGPCEENGKVQQNMSTEIHEMHWRRKMKLNINWYV